MGLERKSDRSSSCSRDQGTSQVPRPHSPATPWGVDSAPLEGNGPRAHTEAAVSCSWPMSILGASMSISPGPGAPEGHRDPALMEHSEYTHLETNTKATNEGCLFGARCSREPATSLVWQRLEADRVRQLYGGRGRRLPWALPGACWPGGAVGGIPCDWLGEHMWLS